MIWNTKLRKLTDDKIIVSAHILYLVTITPLCGSMCIPFPHTHLESFWSNGCESDCGGLWHFYALWDYPPNWYPGRSVYSLKWQHCVVSTWYWRRWRGKRGSLSPTSYTLIYTDAFPHGNLFHSNHFCFRLHFFGNGGVTNFAKTLRFT